MRSLVEFSKNLLSGVYLALYLFQLLYSALKQIRKSVMIFVTAFICSRTQPSSFSQVNEDLILLVHHYLCVINAIPSVLQSTEHYEYDKFQAT